MILLRSTVINNDASIVVRMFNYILGLMGDVVKVMQSIYIFESSVGKVSLFNFLIVIAVMSIVITYLINVARRPYVTSTSTDIARERANERRLEYEDRRLARIESERKFRSRVNDYMYRNR